MKEVMIVVGAGQISMAIARRVGAGKKIILGDKNIENAKNIQKTMVDAKAMEKSKCLSMAQGFRLHKHQLKRF